MPIFSTLQSEAATAVSSSVKSMPFKVTSRIGRRGVGVTFPTNAGVPAAGEGRRLGLDGDLLDIDADLRGDRRRDIRIGEHSREITPRHVIAADLVIEDAELKLEARRVRRVDQHALERRDGAFVIAGLRGEFRILEGEVEIAGVRHHLLKDGLAPRLQLIGAQRLSR